MTQTWAVFLSHGAPPLLLSHACAYRRSSPPKCRSEASTDTYSLRHRLLNLQQPSTPPRERRMSDGNGLRPRPGPAPRLIEGPSAGQRSLYQQHVLDVSFDIAGLADGRKTSTRQHCRASSGATSSPTYRTCRQRTLTWTRSHATTPTHCQPAFGAWHASRRTRTRGAPRGRTLVARTMRAEAGT